MHREGERDREKNKDIETEKQEEKERGKILFFTFINLQNFYMEYLLLLLF